MKNLKSLTKIFWMAGLVWCLVSCEDFLTEDPKGQLSTDTYFTNEYDLKMALNSLYAVVADAMVANNCTGTNMLAGDDISTHPASNKQSLREFDQYNASGNNSWMATVWLKHWSVVKCANFLINNAAKTPGVSAEDIGYAVAQAAYWRAYAYFYLVRTWGPVPITLEEEINYDAPLHPEQEVYDLIVQDLKTAEGARINYTEKPYSMDGRNIAVCQAAAKATLAYVYMSMAGWPLNKGAEYYQLAADKAKEVIDGVENQTYNYSLLDEYKHVYSLAYNNNNPEVILAVYYNKDMTSNASAVADILLDMKQAGWGDTNGEVKFWKDFPEGPRKDASYIPQLYLMDDALHEWWYDTDPPSRSVVAPVFMKSVEGAQRGKEFDYTDPSVIPAYGEKSHQIIRLSEVYCWYAEALGRSGQTNDKAVELLNKVRSRADGAQTNLYPAGMAPTDLAEAAYNEHGWEIGGYYWGNIATRYWDMFRMNRVKDHFEYRKQNPMIEVAPGIFRNEKVTVTGTWDDSRMYTPYPSGDAIMNANLKR